MPPLDLRLCHVGDSFMLVMSLTHTDGVKFTSEHIHTHTHTRKNVYLLNITPGPRWKNISNSSGNDLQEESHVKSNFANLLRPPVGELRPCVGELRPCVGELRPCVGEYSWRH